MPEEPRPKPPSFFPAIDEDGLQFFGVMCAIGLASIVLQPIMITISYGFNLLFLADFDGSWGGYTLTVFLAKLVGTVVFLVAMALAILSLSLTTSLSNFLGYHVVARVLQADRDLHWSLIYEVEEVNFLQFLCLWFGAIVAVFILVSGYQDAPKAVGVLAAVISVILYGRLLLSFRDKGVATFYAMRPILFTYAPLSAVAAVSLLVCYAWMVSLLGEWLGGDLMQYYGVDPAEIAEGMARMTALRDWAVIGEALSWALTHIILFTLALWVVPLLLNRDWGGLAVLGLAIGAPFVMPHLEAVFRQGAAPLVEGAPYLPDWVLTLIVALIAGFAYDRLKSSFGRALVCPECQTRNPVSHRFCSACGNALRGVEIN